MLFVRKSLFCRFDHFSFLGQKFVKFFPCFFLENLRRQNRSGSEINRPLEEIRTRKIASEFSDLQNREHWGSKINIKITFGWGDYQPVTLFLGFAIIFGVSWAQTFSFQQRTTLKKCKQILTFIDGTFETLGKLLNRVVVLCSFIGSMDFFVSPILVKQKMSRSC